MSREGRRRDRGREAAEEECKRHRAEAEAACGQLSTLSASLEGAQAKAIAASEEAAAERAASGALRAALQTMRAAIDAALGGARAEPKDGSPAPSDEVVAGVFGA